MKKIYTLIIAITLLLACSVAWADRPTSQFPAAETISDADLLMISYYNGGTYASRKLTFANLRGALAAYYQPLVAGSDGAYGVSLQNNTSAFTPYTGYTLGFAFINNLPYAYYGSANHRLTETVASGSLALATSSIASGACQTVTQGSVNSAAATGVATTDVISFTPNASIKAATGYVPLTAGGLTITAYPTAGYINFDVCNWTASAITPGAVTINWRVVR